MHPQKGTHLQTLHCNNESNFPRTIIIHSFASVENPPNHLLHVQPYIMIFGLLLFLIFLIFLITRVRFVGNEI